MSSDDGSDAKPMSTDMLEYICDGIQFHTSINGRETRYKKQDCIKRYQAEWKGQLLSTRNMGKGLHKVFKSVVNEILHTLPVLV